MRREESLRVTYGPRGASPSNSVVGDPALSNSSIDSRGSATDATTTEAGNATAQKEQQSHAELFSDPLELNRFVTETERLLTWLDRIDSTSSALGELWDKVQHIASDTKRPTQSVALCCPVKNRRQDRIPYDFNRVVLQSTRNDYINASLVDLSRSIVLGDWCPRYIVAQTPLAKTVADFWTMVLEQGCELIVLLLPAKPVRSDSPMSSLFHDSTANDEGSGTYGDASDVSSYTPAHLPVNKVGARFTVPGSSIELRLMALKEAGQKVKGNLPAGGGIEPPWIERIITVRNVTSHQTRTLVHLTYNGPFVCTQTNTPGNYWSGVDRYCELINHVHLCYKQQRNLASPIAVVSEHGAGKCGTLLLASLGVLHSERLGRLPDLSELAGHLCRQRRTVLNSTEQLVTAMRVVAHAAVELLARRNVIVGPLRRPPTTTDVTTAPVSCTAASSALLLETSMRFEDLVSVVDRWSTTVDGQVNGGGYTVDTVPTAEPSVRCLCVCSLCCRRSYVRFCR